MRNILQQLSSLVSDNGEAYTPPAGPLAGHGIQNWGRTQANNDRYQKHLKAIQNPTSLGAMPATPLPNQWEIMGQVVKGRRNAVEAAGGKFNMADQADYYNEAPVNTRWDDQQVGVTTGNTMGDDMAGFQDALNNTSRPSRGVIGNLRKRFGLS